LEKHLHGPLLLRLKVLARIPTDRSQLPQDGKWPFHGTGGGNYDIRISLIPFLHGEGAVLRILKSAAEFRGLGALGIDDPVAAALESLVRGPSGLLLLTGPTGCGKSTTAHALLHGLNDGTRKIITVEDPVEYAADGIHSVEVSAAQGLGFADALRAVLRQSPDVLFIGEIRDGETAAIAVQAALSGHFVCSTLHCTDTAGAIARLRQLRVPLHSIAAVLRGVLSQRLVRRLCDRCRVPHGPPLPLLERLHLDPAAKLFRATGCPHCSGRGYLGQGAVCEWLPLDGMAEGDLWENLPRAIAPTFEASLREKIAAGITSLEEGLALLF
jgi:type II secretory ATPase GspE/PulE/Tfp pilus assembly ATPase PilB-like protein